MNKPKNIAVQYAEDVLSDRVPACELVKLTCLRYFDDIKNGPARGIYFNEKKAARAVNFFKFVRHSKGKWAGKQFELSPWQYFIVWCIFGFENADGSRRFNYVYIEVARKNGKSTFMAVLGLYLLIADKEAGADIYSAATTHKQAKIVFDEAKNMVKKSPALSKIAGVFQNNIHVTSTLSKFEPVSSEYDTLDGLSPHGGIIDEYHAHKSDGVYNVLKSGMGARENPLLMVITTAGFNKESACYYERKTAIDILKGIKTQDNYFAIVFTLDENDDWENPENWHKANPNIDISINLKFLEKEYLSAKNNPTKLVNFLTKNLNVWTDAQDVWIKDKDWQACTGLIDLEKLKGCECYGGLDLSSNRDLTALCLLFPKENGLFEVIWYYWLPEMTAQDRIKRDNVAYDLWHKQGYIKYTPGNIIDYDFIFSEITGKTFAGQSTEKPCINGLYDLKSIAYDRYNATQIVLSLQDAGIKLTPFGQGHISMNTPTKEIENLVLSLKINHGGNPVSRWMVSNVAIKKDPAGNIKIDKEKASEKVDGIVALVMAYGEYLTAQAAPDNLPQLVIIG